MKTIGLFFLLLTIVVSTNGQQQYNCSILKVVAENKRAFTECGRSGKIILIDTFHLFNNCSDRYGAIQIEVRNQAPTKADKNTYHVGGIGTSKDGLAIGFFHPRSNHVIVYYLSILGTSISIAKIKEGEF